MIPSDNCFKLIADSEGLRLTPYLCPAGVPTIGYGCTRYEDGTPVRMTDPAITVERAKSLMLHLLSGYISDVSRMVTVALTQGEFDALVDFAYNCGSQNLRTSTLLRKLNSGDRQGAADEFGKWTHGNGLVLPGLVRRRENEKELFLS